MGTEVVMHGLLGTRHADCVVGKKREHEKGDEGFG